jgi:hypothetical protein
MLVEHNNGENPLSLNDFRLPRLWGTFVSLLLLAGGWAVIAYQPHHRRCRIVEDYTANPQPQLEHASQHSIHGNRLISPSINCGKCHDPKAHTLIP